MGELIKKYSFLGLIPIRSASVGQDGARASAFLTSSQVIPTLLVQEQHLSNPALLSSPNTPNTLLSQVDCPAVSGLCYFEHSDPSVGGIWFTSFLSDWFQVVQPKREPLWEVPSPPSPWRVPCCTHTLRTTHFPGLESSCSLPSLLHQKDVKPWAAPGI